MFLLECALMWSIASILLEDVPQYLISFIFCVTLIPGGMYFNVVYCIGPLEGCALTLHLRLFFFLFFFLLHRFLVECALIWSIASVLLKNVPQHFISIFFFCEIYSLKRWTVILACINLMRLKSVLLNRRSVCNCNCYPHSSVGHRRRDEGNDNNTTGYR